MVMKTATTVLSVGKLFAVLLLSLVMVQPSLGRTLRASSEEAADEAGPHLVAYEYPPLVTGDKAEPGAAIELVRAAFAAMGKTVHVEVVPSRSIAVQLLTGNGMVVGALAEARLLPAAEHQALAEEKCLNLTGSYYYYLPAYYESTRGLDMIAVHDLKALKGKTYGAVPGEDVESYASAGINVSVGELKLLLRELRNGKVDFLSAFEPAADWDVDKLFPGERDNFAKLPMPAWETSFSLWFNIAHAGARQWHQVFAEGFRKLRQSGAYVKVLRKYKLEPWALKP